jgi:hypothetical protein
MSRHSKPDEADMKEKARIDAALDEALKGTFPASDPLAMTVVDGVKADAPPLKKRKEISSGKE